MPLSDLKTPLYDLLQVPAGDRASWDAHALVAFNLGLKRAQRDHDFKLAEGRGYLTVVPEAGALLASAQAGFSSEAPSGATVSFKSIKRTHVRASGGWDNARTVTSEEYDKLLERYTRQGEAYSRYPTESELTTYGPFSTRNMFTLEGGRVYCPNNSESRVVRFTGQLWLTPFADFTGTNFLVDHGADWLLWYAALHLNHIFGTWVPRSEGELNPPEKQLEDAWNSLVLWDSYTNQTDTIIIAE